MAQADGGFFTASFVSTSGCQRNLSPLRRAISTRAVDHRSDARKASGKQPPAGGMAMLTAGKRRASGSVFCRQKVISNARG